MGNPIWHQWIQNKHQLIDEIQALNISRFSSRDEYNAVREDSKRTETQIQQLTVMSFI